MNNPQQQTIPPKTLHIIRLALLAGILLFGGVLWFLSQSKTEEIVEGASDFQVLRLIFYLMIASVFAGLAFLRQQIQKTPEFAKKTTLFITAYALSEGLALFGGVYFLLTGETVLYLAGLLVFLATFLWIPVPEQEGE